MRTWCNFVREWNVATSAEAANVCAVFVFDAEERPHSSPEDLAQRDAKGCYGGVLELQRNNGVHDPVEAEDRVKDHDKVVGPA